MKFRYLHFRQGKYVIGYEDNRGIVREESNAKHPKLFSSDGKPLTTVHHFLEDVHAIFDFTNWEVRLK